VLQDKEHRTHNPISIKVIMPTVKEQIFTMWQDKEHRIRKSAMFTGGSGNHRQGDSKNIRFLVTKTHVFLGMNDSKSMPCLIR